MALLAAATPALAGTQDAKSKHVLLLSVDGIHDDEVLVRDVRISHRADAYG